MVAVSPVLAGAGAMGPAGPQGPAPAAPAQLSTSLGGHGAPGPVNPVTTNPQAYAGITPQDWANLAAYKAPPTAPPVNPYQSYIDAFNNSQTQARAGLDKSLTQAQQELAGRRDAAAQVAAGLPGQVASAYNGAAAGLQSGENAINASSLPGESGNGAGIMAPYSQALQQDKAGANALGPFIALAQRANYDSGQAALAQQGLIGTQGLAQDKQNFDQALMLKQADNTTAQANQAAQWAHDKAWANDPSNPASIAGQEALKANADQSALASQPAAGIDSTAGMSAADLKAVQGSAPYASAVGAINGYMNDSTISAGRKADLAQGYVTALQTANPQLLATLKAKFPDFFKGAKSQTSSQTDQGASWATGLFTQGPGAKNPGPFGVSFG
jgi:hypothetical protein